MLGVPSNPIFQLHTKPWTSTVDASSSSVFCLSFVFVMHGSGWERVTRVSDGTMWETCGRLSPVTRLFHGPLWNVAGDWHVFRGCHCGVVWETCLILVDVMGKYYNDPVHRLTSTTTTTTTAPAPAPTTTTKTTGTTTPTTTTRTTAQRVCVYKKSPFFRSVRSALHAGGMHLWQLQDGLRSHNPPARTNGANEGGICQRQQKQHRRRQRQERRPHKR